MHWVSTNHVCTCACGVVVMYQLVVKLFRRGHRMLVSIKHAVVLWRPRYAHELPALEVAQCLRVVLPRVVGPGKVSMWRKWLCTVS